MSKRLILILALVFVAAFAFAAYAEVQNVKVSGDITVLGSFREMTLINNSGRPAAGVGAVAFDDREQALSTITRLRIDADLTDNVMTTVRLLNERYWGTEAADTTGAVDNSNTNVNLDLAYVTLKEFLYSPLTLTVGRQELHFGNDMIVGDPDTNNRATLNSAFGTATNDHDRSARKAFDAVRFGLNYDPLVVDVVMAKVAENTINSDDDTDLYGLNVNYALSKKTTLEGYWFEKREGAKAFIRTATLTPKVRRIDTIGARVATSPIENLLYQLEAAYQFGRYHGGTGTNSPTVEQRAWALETSLNYDLKKMKYTPSVGAMYAYFSGDDDDYVTERSRHEAWDPMYENQTFGDLVNAIFDQTNMHIVGINASIKPKEDITLKGDFYAYWWAKAYRGGDIAASTFTNQHTGTALTTTNKSYVGNELDIRAIYDYTEDVQFSLLTGWYYPGGAINGANNNSATEVIGSMKVTF